MKPGPLPPAFTCLASAADLLAGNGPASRKSSMRRCVRTKLECSSTTSNNAHWNCHKVQRPQGGDGAAGWAAGAGALQTRHSRLPSPAGTPFVDFALQRKSLRMSEGVRQCRCLPVINEIGADEVV